MVYCALTSVVVAVSDAIDSVGMSSHVPGTFSATPESGAARRRCGCGLVDGPCSWGVIKD